ncbi:MAG: peptidoglycan -binding protein [Gammaproteobacteria bacterium]
MTVTTRRARYTIDIWPGFVDALASILMVFIFMLLIFVLAQFFLTDTLEGRNKALSQLSQGINQLFDVLSLERKKSVELQDTVETLSGRLRAALTERDSLALELTHITQQAEALRTQATELREELTKARQTISADKQAIEQQRDQLTALQRDIGDLQGLRAQLEAEVAQLTTRLRQREEDLSATGQQRQLLEERLAQEQDTIQAVQTKLTEQQGLTSKAEAEITLLNHQIAALREQLSQLSSALALSETTVADQKLEIAELGQRLNLALADKVEELGRYRSEFFGRLREVLGQRADIQIVGDRFLLQSELLFASGAAELGPEGQEHLRELANTLKDIAQEIPADIEWILSVAGHTDRRPIRTAQFPSNWELSTARALSIAKYLIGQGIPPHRLSAAGFGEFRPVDPANTAEAYRRNRRIEIKLTQP